MPYSVHVFITSVGITGSVIFSFLYSHSQQKRTCKIVQESCKNLACKTCLARACDNMSLFLHDSCTILHIILQEIMQDFARVAARKWTYRVHVPSKSCMQDSCTILHDLASSFLLGWFATGHPQCTHSGWMNGHDIDIILLNSDSRLGF